MADISTSTEPVIDEAKVAGTIGGIATGIFGVLVTVGLIQADDVSTLIGALAGIGTAVVTILNFVLPRIRAARARDVVTPLIAPRDAMGHALLPTIAD